MNVGTELRQAREARGLSVPQLASTTRIQQRVIEGIERNDLSVVPPPPYARGFIAAYAREVGLNPARIVHDYFAQFDMPEAGRATPSPIPIPDDVRPRRWIPALAALAVIVALAALMIRTDAHDPAAPGVVGTTGPGRPPGEALPAAGAPVGGAVIAEPHPSETITVILQTEHASWIAATTDGTRAMYRIVQPGAREILRASEEITVRVGDAGAVRWSVNGRPAELMGRRGEVRDVRVTRPSS